MAKRKRATNHSDFAGPDADREAIEKLASAAEKENAKAGHNSGEVPDEVVRRHIDLVRAAHIEWQEKRDEAATAQGVYRNRLKVAKNDGVDRDALIEAFQVEAEPSSAYTASRRNVGRYLRLMNAPIAEPMGGQGVFDFLDAPVAAKDEKAIEAEATLAGEHAGLNGEPKTNNPHQAGTPQWFGWNNGHQVGADKLADGLRTGNAHPATGAPAH